MNHSATAHIESLSAVCGGQPCIVGTRIRVQDIYVWHELQGSTADEIVSRFPQITPADLAMIKAAGLGVAFRAKPLVAAEADAAITHGDLTALLYLQGYTKDEFKGV